MIAPFGVPAEPEPGQLDVARMMIYGVHLTRLKPDGSGKMDADDAKRFIGSAPGLPIVLAPVNDLGGLAISEGIEDALSLHQGTGLGAWAAGAANRLPALARAVPRYVEVVTILVDDNDAGRKKAPSWHVSSEGPRRPFRRAAARGLALAEGRSMTGRPDANDVLRNMARRPFVTA